jgi:nucleolar MIF4G domain-containing protein 1
MDDKYLSRKQLRKQKRLEKKEKRDKYFRNRAMKKRRDSINSNKSNKSNMSNKSFNSYNNIKNMKLNKDKLKNQKKEKEIEIKEKEKKEIQNEEIYELNTDKKKYHYEEEDELEKELRYLEGKLKLKDPKEFEKFNKTITMENYDPDLMDFLGNIDSIMNIDKEEYLNKKSIQDKEKRNKNKGIEKEKQNSKDKEEKEKIKNKKIKKENEDEPKSMLKKDNNKDISKKEIINKFQREINSLLNKIAESNISLLVPDMFKKIEEFKNNIKDNFILFDLITKISLKLLLNQEITNLPITSCICSFISLCHFKFGNNFIYFYLKNLFEEIEYLKNEEIPKYKIKNFIFEIIHFYIFQNITSTLVYSLIKYLIDNFNENNSEFLLLLLSYTGIEIRKEDPENLKIIVSEVKKKYNNRKINNSLDLSKLQFAVEMIEDIKQNKYLKFNLSEKFSFFKNFVNNNSNTSLKKGEKIECDIETISKIDLNTISNSNNNEISENSNINNIKLDNYLPNDDILDDKTNKILELKMKKMNISTNLKKMIFTSIVTASDVNDAFERLMRLSLKKEQKREIIKIILQLCSEEKCYNPFYEFLLNDLMSVDKNNKYTYHYCIWDYMKIFENYNQSELKKIHNLSKLTGNLLIREKIGLPVLLHFKFEESDDKVKIFVLFVLDFYFEKSDQSKTKLLFAKLVKNDEHVEWAQHLFHFLVQQFSQEIDISSKNEIYQENFGSAVKILKKIL